MPLIVCSILFCFLASNTAWYAKGTQAREEAQRSEKHAAQRQATLFRAQRDGFERQLRISEAESASLKVFTFLELSSFSLLVDASDNHFPARYFA